MSSKTQAQQLLIGKYYLNICFNCTNLDTYFSANHKPINVTATPNFYSDIHCFYMKYFKQEPTTIKDISNQILWLNKYITIDNKIIY